ncbi:hypothetical protein DYB32_003505 [Aphanomyces invadans]|uniref:WASH complex subunit 4 N-terminal domain-containing protein n=1 Tax=Aphanomyces invadans TaxID=157072 RepID=A0A418B0D0_9STRA|nr:hypothetical protein DYB32_003505 [Aphanomyces invadans]
MDATERIVSVQHQSVSNLLSTLVQVFCNVSFGDKGLAWILTMYLQPNRVPIATQFAVWNEVAQLQCLHLLEVPTRSRDVLVPPYAQHLTAEKGMAMYRMVVHHIAHFCFTGAVTSLRKQSMLLEVFQSKLRRLIHDMVSNPTNETTRAMLTHAKDLDPFAPYSEVIQECLNNIVLTVFAVLCDEISELKVTVEDNFYPALIMFGQAKHGDKGDVKPGEDEVHIGRMLPFFQDISNFVDRCNAIATNLVHQLASLYQSIQKLWKSTFKHVHLTSVFDAFAHVLEILITLDLIVLDNPNIVTSWDKYKRMMQYVRADPARLHDKIEICSANVMDLLNCAKVFQTCIEQDFETTFSYEDSGKFNGSLSTQPILNERIQLVGAAGLYVVFRKLLPNNVLPDVGLFDKLWQLQLKAPVVVLCGRLSWHLPEFLLKYAPLQSKTAQPVDVVQARPKFDDVFEDDVVYVQSEVRAWLVRFESFFQMSTRGGGDSVRILGYISRPRCGHFVLYCSTSVAFRIRGNLIVKGLILAKRIQTMMQTMLQLHLQLNIPMPKRILRPLYHCIEMNKAIEFMLARKNPILAESAALILRQVAHALMLFFRPIKAKLEASKRFDDTKLDVLAAVSVVEDILHTGESFSSTRLTVLSLAVQIALISDEDNDKSIKKAATSSPSEALKLLWKLQLLCDFQRKIRLATDCSFLYWSRELLTLFVQDMYSVPENANRIQYVVLKMAGHEENAVAYYVGAYAAFVEEVVEEELVGPLCMDIENDLRLHVHSVHLDHMETPNPINNTDFKIMRNIHVFVGRYNYNLNQQFFLERRNDKGSRHLNAISIHSIASSIRTHGMGILNTTVNFTYQFLNKKFDIFSQFLYDDYIKSFLKREVRWYKAHKTETQDHKYPYQRAFEFNKGLLTWISKTSVLILSLWGRNPTTRMLHIHNVLFEKTWGSNAIKFVPDLNKRNFEFEAMATELSPETRVAAKNVDTVVSNLSRNFSENNDYFHVLVEVFQQVVLSQKHLGLFYQIVPALTINFIETTVQAKDLMYKNTRRRESYFTDDGFAIGIAYLLAILNQGEAFDSLHWFEEVERKFEADEAAFNIKQAERDARKQANMEKNKKETTADLIEDEEEVHTLQLTAKRIELHRREFDLLNWSLNGARIFFKD